MTLFTTQLWNMVPKNTIIIRGRGGIQYLGNLRKFLMHVLLVYIMKQPFTNIIISTVRYLILVWSLELQQYSLQPIKWSSTQHWLFDLFKITQLDQSRARHWRHTQLLSTRIHAGYRGRQPETILVSFSFAILTLLYSEKCLSRDDNSRGESIKMLSMSL